MKCTIVQCVGGWGGQRAVSCCCHFGQKRLCAQLLKDLPPTQRCRDSVSLDCGCDGKRFSSAALNKKGTFSHLGGQAGCSTAKDCGVLRSMINSEDDALLTFLTQNNSCVGAMLETEGSAPIKRHLDEIAAGVAPPGSHAGTPLGS